MPIWILTTQRQCKRIRSYRNLHNGCHQLAGWLTYIVLCMMSRATIVDVELMNCRETPVFFYFFLYQSDDCRDSVGLSPPEESFGEAIDKDSVLVVGVKGKVYLTGPCTLSLSYGSLYPKSVIVSSLVETCKF